MTECLVGDIGGTNARFGWVGTRGARPEDVVSIRCADIPDPAAAVEHYLESTGRPRPAGACFAVAGPVGKDSVALTNGPWRFSKAALAERLGLGRLLIVNDFAAQAASLSRFEREDFEAIGARDAPGSGTRVALGPGTGLGIAAAVPVDDRWVLVSGEGGHCSFAATDEGQWRVQSIVSARHGRVSNERLLSGSGLVEIYRALCEVDGTPCRDIGPGEITAAALNGSSPVCCRTVSMFLDILASVAGDAALCFGATGGVFLSGGILPRVASLIDAVSFRSRFVDKGAMTGYAESIPTFLVTTPHAGLIGAAAIFEESCG